MMIAGASRYPPQSSCASVTRHTQAPKHQVCDHCGGRFGLVTHRWWGNKFCKKVCKDAYIREICLDRDAIRRWFGFPRAPRRAHGGWALQAGGHDGV
jgi:hypothetical protein